MPTFADIKLSPQGQYFAARYNENNNYVLSVFEINGAQINHVAGFEEDETISVNWFEWTSPDRLLVSIGFTAKRQARVIVQTNETRLVSLDVTANQMMPLFRQKKFEAPVQVQDNIISFLPSDPDHVLLQYRPKNSPGPIPFKVNVRKQEKHKAILRGRPTVLSWMADHDGDIRLGAGIKGPDDAYLMVRAKGEKKWIDLSHRVNVDGISFRPIGFANEPNLLYVKSNHEGDPSGLYYFDVAADKFGTLIYKHPTVDISSTRIDDTTGELLSVNFVDDEVLTKYFVERPIAEKIDRIRRQLPDHNVQTFSVSRDGKHAALRVSSAKSPGAFLLYNGIEENLTWLPPQFPQIADESLGKTFSVEYSARDGLVIPAYITLPPQYQSLEQASNLPFVIHPHGGPGARDFLRFSFDVQFLASLGYGVLQMNFRGSTGYGQAFQDAGKNEWGQAMQDDVTDGVHWLIENEFADANRIAIAGGSYGGYVALMGAIKTPDLVSMCH